jgi:hypothetical protein
MIDRSIIFTVIFTVILIGMNWQANDGVGLVREMAGQRD